MFAQLTKNVVIKKTTLYKPFIKQRKQFMNYQTERSQESDELSWKINF